MKRSTPIIAALLCLFAGMAGAQLAVYPEKAQLDHAADPQRMTVVFTRDDGVTLDVTQQAEVAFTNGDTAVWERETGRVLPLADGETALTFTYEGLSVTAPVIVANASERPAMSFEHDVLPVLMRAGCNAGSCHGSAQGKNGFRMSLFGFDPPQDFLALTREQQSRRINVALPAESLLLQKPTGEVVHEGGTVLEKDGPLYQRLHTWIAEGAQEDPEGVPALTGITVLPTESVLQHGGDTQQIVVMAQYADGADRDVTDLAILASSDDLTVTVDAAGKVTAAEPGEAYVMARFGSFALVSQVIVVPRGLEREWPGVEARNYIDEFAFAKLKKLRVPPAELCSDSIFVRRVYLDILGALPTPEETRAFLEDETPEKRAALVDTLLQRPEFSELWAMKWAEVLRVTANDNTLTGKAMHRYNDWLRQAITANQPLDELVRGLLTAEGGNFTNPAANFYLAEQEPTVMAENVAQVFMGIRLQCAQCHNHPFERWTMDDYYSFSAFFAQVGKKASTDPRENIVYNSGSGDVKNLRDGQVMPPKFLGGDVPDTTGRDRRELLAEWLTAPENPWFASNIANRVWDHFFGAGIIDPPDDVRVTNPPANPQLLAELGKKLVEYNYDLRQLVRDICLSHTYQMSTQPRIEDLDDERNLASARVRRLPAEQLLDAIGQVTGAKLKLPNLPLGARAVEVAGGPSGVYFLDVFGRPPRDSVCTCERRNEPTLAQTLHLINGATIDQAIRKDDGRLARLLAEEGTNDVIIDELYLAAFSRAPSEEERAQIAAILEGAEDRQSVLEDVFWSVLNSKEFVFNH
jgi:hypothetical protein